MTEILFDLMSAARVYTSQKTLRNVFLHLIASHFTGPMWHRMTAKSELNSFCRASFLERISDDVKTETKVAGEL